MKVLVAEDNAMQAAALRRLVQALGHECVVAADGEQAWALYQQQGADLLISDWIMPGLDGPELCRRVRAHRGTGYTYIVLLTVLDDQEHARSGMQAGADDYLGKPLAVHDLEVCLIAASRITELHRELSQRQLQRDAVLRLAQQLAAEGDPEQLLGVLLAEAAVLLGGTAGVVTLWDEEHGVLVPVRNTIPTAAGDARPAAGQAASARAVERRARVLLNEYEREAGDEETGAHAAVAAPLVHGDRLLGAIAVVSHAEGKRFTPEDAEVLQQLASIGGAALVGLDRARFQGALLAMPTLEARDVLGKEPGGRGSSTRLQARLPAQPTPLLGRDHELEQVRALLLRSDVGLVTLTGPAGVGKTRLAAEVGSQLNETFEDGAAFVDLSSVNSPAMVLPAIAKAFGLSAQGLEPLCRALEDRQLLLVLDNFEHLLPAAGAVSELMGGCPSIKVLVTSRAALRLRSEHVYPVPPLALPDPSAPLDPIMVAQSPAVALFVQRAQAARPGFSLTDDSLTTVAEICARLDGLPLAIELAAARSMSLSVRSVLAQLRQGLGVLAGGSRDLPERQQTLREAIAWSYALLDAEDQRLFRCLAVFEGGLTVEATEAVASDGAGAAAGTGGFAILDALSGLVEKNLLVRDPSPSAESRFRMLHTIREYAREQLELHGELAAVAGRHAGFFVGLAEQAGRELRGPNQTAWLAQLDSEHGNLRAALRWAAEAGDFELELRLTGALARFWAMRGYLDNEEQEWMRRAVVACPAVPTAVRAQVLAGAASFAAARGDWAAARSFGEQSLSGWRELDDGPRVAEMLAQLALARQRAGDRGAALALARESEAVARDLGDSWGLACALHTRGEIALGQGNGVGARKQFSECLAVSHAAGLASQVVVALEGLAAVAAARGQSERALRLAGGADQVRKTLHLPLYRVQRELFDRRLGPTRAALDEARRVAVWAEGHAVPTEQLIADALQAGAPGARVDTNAEDGTELKWLTRREREVAALVAEGLHNAEIGARLGISPNTVEVHMSKILGKLDMDSRAQLAVWAAERGLHRVTD